MRWIYISPHLDDAVLSAGGLIHEQTRAGLPVEIWTLMCGFPPGDELSPFAQVLHFQWGFPSAGEAVRLRRAEDERAAAIVGAKTVHFDFLDCIYRRGADGSWLYPLEVFVPPLPEEADLPAQIAAAISARLQPDDVVVGQFGIGRHVDHATVRRAVERLNRPIWYDADIPYLFNHPSELAPNTAGMQEALQPVTESGLEAWVEGISAYRSQLSSLFESPEALFEAVRAYGRDKGGISLWRLAANES
ncbi:MAG: PIG-L deacetylase family protein [Chloroflexota bacterium]